MHTSVHTIESKRIFLHLYFFVKDYKTYLAVSDERYYFKVQKWSKLSEGLQKITRMGTKNRINMDGILTKGYKKCRFSIVHGGIN